ncbi:MAG: hypothetical protein R3C27_11020 [Hyphomonadaceae bacterium]
MKSTPVLATALAAALLFTAAPASAQRLGGLLRNRVTVEQTGVNNGAAIAQNGRANNGVVTQQGADNLGIVQQNGDVNSGGVRQRGAGNTATLTQNNSNNRGCVVQSGTGLSANVNQNGGQYTAFIQTDRGVRPISGALANRLCRR